MPQAPDELRAQFADDTSALEVIKANFSIARGGVIYPKSPGRPATEREMAAVDYLALEWDYGYQDAPPPDVGNPVA
jgi:hypothetical protein